MRVQFKAKIFYLLIILSLNVSWIFAQNDSLGFAKIYSEQGLASFYSKKFEGRKTASGEIYSGKKLTAAHRNLPFGTKVKVTNLSNGKFVIVTINDFGPRNKNRIIDLSQKAARHIGMLNKIGLTEVLVEQIPLIPPPDNSFRKHEVE